MVKHFANDFVVASNLSNTFTMPVGDCERTAKHSMEKADGVSTTHTNEDPVRMSKQVTEDTREPSKHPPNDTAIMPKDLTKDYERVPNDPIKDFTEISDCTTKNLGKIPNELTANIARTSPYTKGDLGKIPKDPIKDLEKNTKDPIPNDSTTDLERSSKSPIKDSGGLPHDPPDLSRPSECTTGTTGKSPKHGTKERNPKHSTKDLARSSKRSTKDHSSILKHTSSTTPRLSSKDKEVRRLARNVVGSMETLMGDLHGIVGDIRQLVQQIDTITDKIDHTCRHKGARLSDANCSPTKRHQYKRNGEAPVFVSSSHSRGGVGIEGTASLGRNQPGSVENTEQAATNAALHRLSYPQCSRWSPVPESEPLDTDKKKQRHSKSSKKTRDNRQASQKKHGKTEDCEKHLPQSVNCDYISESPKDSGSAFASIMERYKIHGPCNGANVTQGNWASSDMSKYLPGSPSSFTTGEFDPSFINTVSPDSEADWIKGTDTAKDLDNPIPFGAYEDKTAAQTRDSDGLSASSASVGHNRPHPNNCLETLMPDTSLKYWKEKMEWHCGSAESLTPQIDWSYLALTDHPIPGTALAGSFNPHHTDRMEPDSLLLHHHTMWSFASPQTSLPSNPHKAANASPVPPSETSNKPYMVYAQSPNPEQHKSKPFLYTYNPNPEQPKGDPSKLALTGLRIKHELGDFSDKLKGSDHGDQCLLPNGEPPNPAVLSQGEKLKGLLTLSDAPRSVVTDQASLRWKCSGAFAYLQSHNACGSSGESPCVKKPSTDSGKSNSTGVFHGKTEPLSEVGSKRNSGGNQVVDGVRLTRNNAGFLSKDRHRHGGGVYRSNAGVFSYVGRQCMNGFRVDINSSAAFMKDRPQLVGRDVSGNGALGMPLQAEKQSTLTCSSADRNGEEESAQPEQSQLACNAPVERSSNGICAVGIGKPRSSSESGTHPGTGVFPHVKQGVGGAPLGWNTSNKALPDWPSGDLSSIDASDTDVDDLSSPFLPLHFQFPRRSSAVDTSPERSSKHSNPRRSRVASSTSDNCSQDDSPPLQRHARLRSVAKRMGEGRLRKGTSSPSGACSSEDSSLQNQDLQLSGESSAQKSSNHKRKFKHCSVAGTNPEQTHEQIPSAECVAGDTMSSGGFEVGQSVDVTPESDLVAPNGGQYECEMESRLEQLSSEADESDFSDADADVGSDVLEQSLASLEISGSAIYDRDVSTWKSYTMTHIDSDDVVSECASDILNENFVESATANPGFDDVNLNFDDINFPSMAY